MINIFIKSLTASPLPDFNLCISLLDERPVNTTLDEPDPLPVILPILKGLHDLLYRCRFPAFWEIYRSDQLETLRDNYTVECVGFEDAVRDVVIRAVKAAFTRIGTERLSSYLDLNGKFTWFREMTVELIHELKDPNSRLTSKSLGGLLTRWLLLLVSHQTLTTRLNLRWFKKISNYPVRFKRLP